MFDIGYVVMEKKYKKLIVYDYKNDVINNDWYGINVDEKNI